MEIIKDITYEQVIEPWRRGEGGGLRGEGKGKCVFGRCEEVG